MTENDQSARQRNKIDILAIRISAACAVFTALIAAGLKPEKFWIFLKTNWGIVIPLALSFISTGYLISGLIQLRKLKTDMKKTLEELTKK